MFARNVAFSLQPNSVPELTQKFKTEVLPLLQKQAGFREEFVLLSDDNIHVHAISLWESRAGGLGMQRVRLPTHSGRHEAVGEASIGVSEFRLNHNLESPAQNNQTMNAR
jgi:hypothetical protein